MTDTPTPALDAVEHTPEPWAPCFHLRSAKNDASCPCGYRGSIWGPDEDAVICEMGSTLVVGEEALCPPRYPRAVELANARRIVACVNALSGISTEDIEAGAVRNLVEAARFAFHAMSFADAIEEHNRLQAALSKFTTLKGE